MGRKTLTRISGVPYHITTRSNNREWFNIPLADVWLLVIVCLRESYQKYPFNLFAFILMNNHYHMLIETPDRNIDKVMLEFNRRFSEGLRKRTNRINRMFGGRYSWSIIDSDKYLFNVLKYIYQNPVKAKTVMCCENYSYSTLYICIRMKDFPVPLRAADFHGKHLLKWFNSLYNDEQQEIIRKGLKKNHFRPCSAGP